MDELLAQPDGAYLTGLLQNYARAIEKVLAEVPVVNGTVDLETIWMELALPRDLLIEVFQTTDVHLPINIEKIVSRDGRILAEHKPAHSEATL